MPGSSSEVREAQISGFLKMRENTENPQKATIFPFENESIKSWHKRVEIGIEVHFKGWNLCRKFLTNWAAIKNSTHRQETLKEKLDFYAKLSGLPIFKLGNDPYVTA